MSNKILIINSTFYEKISQRLLDGCIREIEKHKYDYEIIETIGAFEIPATISILENDNYSGYIALGCIIRGETSHYDHVANEAIRGINELAIKRKLAIGNGIITVENQKQALERSDFNNKNKGTFATQACIKMIDIKKNISK